MKKNAFLDMRQTHKSIFLSHLYSSTYQIDLCSIHGLLTLLCFERSGTNQFKLLSSNHATKNVARPKTSKHLKSNCPHSCKYVQGTKSHTRTHTNKHTHIYTHADLFFTNT